MDIKQRLLKHIKKTDSCWLWTGCKVGLGYGRIKIDKKLYLAHRISYEIYRGHITTGLCVLHACDIPSCVNPDHLFLGTKKDNAQDMFQKRRENPRKGQHNGNSRLTQTNVDEIRSLFIEGTRNSVIAEKFGVHVRTIEYIRSGRLWKKQAS